MSFFRLDVGGLENGLVNLINQMPSDRYRHAIICLTDATAFAKRLQKPDVEIVCLQKSPGTDWGSFRDFYRTMKRLKPCLVHTRNLAGLEYLVPAACAGVSGRVHGEHGRDTYDLDGTNWKYLTLRRLLNPLVSRYTTVSQDLAHWLSNVVGLNLLAYVKYTMGWISTNFILEKVGVNRLALLVLLDWSRWSLGRLGGCCRLKIN